MRSSVAKSESARTLTDHVGPSEGISLPRYIAIGYNMRSFAVPIKHGLPQK